VPFSLLANKKSLISIVLFRIYSTPTKLKYIKKRKEREIVLFL